ncbi:tRNA methyltransferase complex GCD14 subunit-domain-containing protein [Gautieria morchelliformis]|nr:tRNA methyltransferase complex GCD14 subunit-domain-containing protein [Gautieria morchelliformis]
MWSTAREIAEGDVVIVWLTREAVHPLTITAGKEFNGRFGAYKHSDLIGVPYGSKVACRNGKGFIHVLRPTPELWTLALPHRTQILYLADIAFVTAWLGIRPGSHVIEAGTGSGSFAHSVARTIGSRGRLYTFEFHQSRVAKAREEFMQHGMSDYVILQHRNVCKDGFDLQDEIDCVFLDLPAPWDAIPHVKRAVRKDRIVRICCFSPCIEQVLRTVSALNEHGYTDITMYETLLRPHEVAQLPAPVPIHAIRNKLQIAEVQKEDRRLKQIAASKAKRDGAAGASPSHSSVEQSGSKRKRGAPNDDTVDDGGDGGSKDVKRVKTGDVNAGDTDHLHECVESFPSGTDLKGKGKQSPASSPPPLTVTQPIKEVRGHTSYLTFACLLPSIFPTPDAGRPFSPEMEAIPEPAQPSPESPGPQPIDEDNDQPPPGHLDGLQATPTTVTPPAQ